ncbi:cation diffusion facilitator family transporter [Nocardioides sp. Arc9.136]|uniref:cation diffusion facilitator family transporter n=1 Tax=Nocardioides sp. Arc9.136 TaxID=2996826 RepID=UPI002666064C|nr:cation transporter [Nocardioides sp. Arc9.136]WKN46620.1 cation transporter [Nocardioides sp. Arc9.136]
MSNPATTSTSASDTVEATPRAALSATERARLGRRAQLLAGAAVTYNVVEAVIAIAAGLAAGSVALVGFGLDSVVEVSSGLIILWQFRHALPESRERQALRAMAVSFFALAAYVTFESVRALATGSDPDTSTVGIALAAASLLVMPFLSVAQRRTGRALSSSTVVADSTQTLLCTYLSAVLLVGLVLNATLGWSWADPIAGLVIAVVALREGLEAWRGEACGCGPAGLGAASADGCGGGCGAGCQDECCQTTDIATAADRRALLPQAMPAGGRSDAGEDDGCGAGCGCAR